MTQVAPCAGSEFSLDTDKLTAMNTQVDEMDRVEQVEVDAATFRYQEELVNVYRNIADPFEN